LRDLDEERLRTLGFINGETDKTSLHDKDSDNGGYELPYEDFSSEDEVDSQAEFKGIALQLGNNRKMEKGISKEAAEARWFGAFQTEKKKPID